MKMPKSINCDLNLLEKHWEYIDKTNPVFIFFDILDTR